MANEETKTKSVKEAASRHVVESVDAAKAYIGNMAETYDDFAQTPLVGAGIDDEGNFDSDVYPEGMRISISRLMSGGEVKALVVFPAPSVDQIGEESGGSEWLQKIIDKELNHVAVRALRDADDVQLAKSEIPTTIGAFITTGRGAGSGLLAAYNELYKSLIDALGAKVPAFAKARFTKGEFRKCLESTAYAAEYFPALEDYNGNSLFEVALNLGKVAASRQGLDPAIFDRWLETRDQKAFEAEDVDVDSFDLDSIAGDMLAADEDEEEAEQADA